MAQRPYYGYATKHYGAQYKGHDVELVFNKKLLVLNRAMLLVDGVEVDKERIFYGNRTLEATLEDGTTVRVEVTSGMAGELLHCSLVAEDGTAHPMQERPPAEPPSGAR